MEVEQIEQKWYGPLTLDEVPTLTDGDLRLIPREVFAGNWSANWVPAIGFDMFDVARETKVGTLDLRLGDTPELILHGGHVGYTVDEPFRGRRFAARAVRMALQVAWEAGMKEVWITCAPDNTASRRTCELAGGKFVELRELADWSALKVNGRSHSCRFLFTPGSK